MSHHEEALNTGRNFCCIFFSMLSRWQLRISLEHNQPTGHNISAVADKGYLHHRNPIDPKSTDKQINTCSGLLPFRNLFHNVQGSSSASYTVYTWHSSGVGCAGRTTAQHACYGPLCVLLLSHLELQGCQITSSTAGSAPVNHNRKMY